MNMNLLFYQLIQVALGSRESLSHIPDEEEWETLYKFATKHSLLGICFGGIRKLLMNTADRGKDKSSIGMSNASYAKWLSNAVQIQNGNILMNRKCKELQDKVDKDGFWSCVLKGQGIAQLYGPLADLRQFGDIDIWLWPKGNWDMDHSARVRAINKYLQTIDGVSHMTYHNSSVNFFDDVKVEAHYTPSWMFSPAENRRLQKWIEKQAPSEMAGEFSSESFNLIYVLLHIYRHILGEGIGLRQCLDYYFVLIHANEEDLIGTDKLLKSLGLTRFARGLMYVLQTCFGMEEKYLLCLPDKNEGSFLLREIMYSGNFGKYDKRLNRRALNSLYGSFRMHVSRNFHFLAHYPKEVLWCPLWKVWHQVWLKQYDLL